MKIELMKTLKIIFNNKKKIIYSILLIFSILIISCNTNNPKMVAEKKTEFVDSKWNRFNYITHKIEIKDTIATYQIELEFDYLSTLSTQYIPIIFSITSPDSAQSHIRTTLNLTKSAKSPYALIIYPQKYFSKSGIYSFQFFQKTSQYDIEGARSITMKIRKSRKK